jgi:drug/metabolite transporter (DMT)-like permease
MAMGALLFALMNFFARLATASASWATVACVRALIGALVAFTVARMRGRSLVAKDKRAIFWRSLFGTISMLSTFYALSSRTVSLGDTVTLLNLAPVFLALFAPFFLGERTSGSVVIAIGLALVGVVLVVRPSFLFGASSQTVIASVLPRSGPSVTTTIAVAVLAALSTSIAMMLLRRVGQSESAEAIAFHFSLFAAVALGAISLFDLRAPSARDAGLMVAAGLCAGFGQLAMTRAYSLESAARVGGMSYLAVVASAILGAVVLGERPTPTALVGMVLVISGGLVSLARGISSRSRT